MLKQLKTRVAAWSRHKYADRLLAVLSFCESSFFPIPPDVMLIPMVLADRQKAYRHTFICTLASVLGAVLGYLIGMVLFDSIGQAIIDFYAIQPAYDQFIHLYMIWGFWVVVISAISFVPFKLATIAGGVMAMDPFLFLFACLLGRAVRFYGVMLVLTADLHRWLYQPQRLGLLIWLGSLAVIITAFAFEYIGGLQPCPLCLQQRQPYYAALLLLPPALLLHHAALRIDGSTMHGWRKNGPHYMKRVGQVLFVLVSLGYFIGSGLGIYHAGIEWQFWPAPSSCTAGQPELPTTVADLQTAMQQNAIIPCDEAPWRLFGLSMAGYNAILSLTFAMLAAWAARISFMAGRNGGQTHDGKQNR